MYSDVAFLVIDFLTGQDKTVDMYCTFISMSKHCCKMVSISFSFLLYKLFFSLKFRRKMFFLLAVKQKDKNVLENASS